ncbi:MAG: threonine--tRNA ligase, partial [Planctomycetota bacterium]
MRPFEELRRSAAHFLATALQRLDPETKSDIGPPTEVGFFYDVDSPKPHSTEDFATIGAEMARFIAEDQPFERRVVTRAEAHAFSADRGQPFQLGRLGDIPADETITFYVNGDFIDLCAGPHVESTLRIGAFKLLSISGSYYGGDQGQPQLQRVYGAVYRMEQSGELNGLVRVRGFTQDDGHVFCTRDQLKDEFQSCVRLVEEVMAVFDLGTKCRVSLRDPNNVDKYVGADSLWTPAEACIREVVDELGLDHEIGLGEAAFYGPKLDFMALDALGRSWQLGTIQVDFSLPDRFDLQFVGSDNRPHRPVMIHRAVFGSFERFVGRRADRHDRATVVRQRRHQVQSEPAQTAVLADELLD